VVKLLKRAAIFLACTVAVLAVAAALGMVLDLTIGMP
jgi:hypothetical protein